MDENKKSIHTGLIHFSRELISGRMHYDIFIELPEHLNLPINAIFREDTSVNYNDNELLEYSDAFYKIGNKFIEWSKYLKNLYERRL